ncbi:unnamed protein product [Chondrus crispus]|uniref:Uncharacterized protein n=1 Tax=Chondrus crispus TaxID=2769 RepID=R7QPJ2_CHOCR|nr:unnamed protein product [Chondrus crispus]CDF39698.1 unnamed protein product [Chondrus crispus]|eukprot:XP_005709992.1 unnamed protein product [Chondrus crispus]
MEFADGLQHKCFRVEGIQNRTSCLDLVAVSAQDRCQQTRECNGGGERGSMGRIVSRTADEDDPGGTEIDALNRAVPPIATDGGVVDEGDAGESEEGGKGGEKTSCFLPVLPMQQQLVDIEVRGVRNGEQVIFFYEGYPQVLGQSVTVSSYVPRLWRYLPVGVVALVARLDIPNVLERLLQYFSSISLGLAILNMAPVFYLDGEMSSVLFARLFMPKMETATAMKVRSGVVGAGTMLLALNMAIALLEIDPEVGSGFFG